jgi:hypothetical protein
MAITDKNGNWIDPVGRPVPKKYVQPILRRRDALVEKLHRLAVMEQERLARFKAQVDKDIDDYLAKLAKEHGEESLNEGGNYILTNFSGNRRVQLKIGKFIEFDERLNVAKQKIDRCLEKWGEGGNENLKVIVYDTFKVDQKGRVDTKSILGLRRHQIKDKDWQDAMELISEAVTVVAKKAYLLFQVRPNQDSEWETIRLDLAGV